MTDTEIIKALECCIVDDYYKIRNALCAKCAYSRYNECKRRLQLDTLDLLNRQKAEIERLKNAYKQCAWERDVFSERNGG